MTASGAHPVASPYAAHRSLVITSQPEHRSLNRVQFCILLLATAALYLVNLSSSGWAKWLYSSSTLAGATSWRAFFFGSLDSSNFVTIDTPPAPLWLTGLSVRIFGFNPWSVLVPQALLGVASVAVLYATVQRWYSPAAALLAGSILALTPVATLLFRFNQPDALMTFLLIAAAYCIVRAIDDASARWVLIASVCLGFAFLTKTVQALFVLPGFTAAYLVAAPGPLRRRIGAMAAGFIGLVVSSGWWIAIVAAFPPARRPAIGETTHNSILELVFGANGLGRIIGAKTSSAPTPPGRGAGLNRLFSSYVGGQISWLLPAAAIFAVWLLWSSRGTDRTDRTRATAILWGCWLLVSGLAFSVAKGSFHAYYSIELAPPVAALAGIGAVQCWHRRDRVVARAVPAAAVGVTAGWSYLLLHRTPLWLPALAPLVLAAGMLSAVLIAARSVPRPRLAAAIAVLVCLIGPAAYSLDTAAHPHTGDDPIAGPAAPVAIDLTPDPRAVMLVRANAERYRWAAATIGSFTASRYQLSTRAPVMSIGGPSGIDPIPDLATFRAEVSSGRIHYFVVADPSDGNPNSVGPGAAAILDWVEDHYIVIRIGSSALYDLTAR